MTASFENSQYYLLKKWPYRWKLWQRLALGACHTPVQP